MRKIMAQFNKNDSSSPSRFGFYPINVLAALILLALLFTSSGLAQNEKGISKYGALFLTIPAEARQVAMGSAFTGIANDVNLMRYNVGGLGNLRKISLAANFHNWIDDTQQGTIGFVLPGKLGVLAVNLAYFNEGQIAEVNENFVPTGFNLESNDFAFQMGYGTFLNLGKKQNLGMGIGFKYIRQNLVGDVANAFGADVGLHYIYRGFSLGATVQDIGITKIKFDQKKDQLPLTYRGGMGLNWAPKRNFNWTLAADIAYTAGQNLRYYTGLEFLTLDEVVSLRAGYKIHDTDASHWAAGMGVNIPLSWLANSVMRFDYAFSPMQYMDLNTHIFSVIFTFGVTQPVSPLGVQEVDTREFDKYREKWRAEISEAEKARKALQESQRQAKIYEDSLKARLERAQAIAETSGGKIEVEVKVPGEEVLVTMRINFDFDKANIRKDEYSTMSKVGQILNTYADANVFLSGHTDWIGPEEYNIRLSQRRVDSVLVFLVAREKVTKERFFWPIGYGELVPIDDNGTPEGRARNRRVEFLLFTTDKQPEIPIASGIRGIQVPDANTTMIIANGKTTYTYDIIENPLRLVVDFPNVYLLMDDQTIEINRGPFIRARLGFHPDERFTRVVFDLNRSIDFTISDFNNIITIKTR